MFDIFAYFLSSIASTLFPLFASYKALKTSDPAQLTPWLMYWVVLACALLVESWTEWLLVWIPLYPYLRLLFLLYLVLPQTQGACIIYTTYVHPYLEENESQIEELIATTHDNMKSAGMAYLKRAIELLRTQVLGMAPGPDAPQRPDGTNNSSSSNVPASQRPRGYTQSLLDRFQLPQARWPGAGAGAAGQDFYKFLSNAVNAAAAMAVSDKTGAGADATGSTAEAAAASPSVSIGGPAVGAFPGGDVLSASGTLVPPNIRGDADKMSFLAAQRERLSLVLGALDREAAQLRSGAAATTPATMTAAAAAGDVSVMNTLDDLQAPTLNTTTIDRPATSHSGKSTGGLSKSRSEVDFEKIEAESGAEDNAAQDAESARATPAAASGGAGGGGGGGGSWLPWGWSGASSSSDVGKNKSE